MAEDKKSKFEIFQNKLKRKLKSFFFSPYMKQIGYQDHAFQFYIGTFEGSLWYGDDRDSLIGDVHLELEWTKAHIEPNEIIADIGAHHGYFSMLYSKWAGIGGKVFAFECHPDNYQILKRNLAVNSIVNVSPHPFAVGAKKGEVAIADDSSGILLSSKNKRIKVPMISLDEYFQLQDCFPTFLKIDVEGYELEVLQGSLNLLKKGPKIVLEIHNFAHEKPEDRLWKIFDLLKGYKQIFLQRFPGSVFEKLPEDRKIVLEYDTPRLCFLP